MRLVHRSCVTVGVVALQIGALRNTVYRIEGTGTVTDFGMCYEKLSFNFQNWWIICVRH